MARIKTKRDRVKFASDNVVGACPEVLDAILKANEGDRAPYGNDQISTDLQKKFSDLFEKEVIVFPTASGTAANALALSTMTPSFGNIYCHKLSHINTDECGAPEFYTGGGKLITLNGIKGKITADELGQAICGKGIVHHTQPSSVSITQVCETGEVYQLDEIKTGIKTCYEELGIAKEGLDSFREEHDMLNDEEIAKYFLDKYNEKIDVTKALKWYSRLRLGEQIKNCVEEKGYSVQVTQKVADFGIDVIATNETESIGIQVKHWEHNVGFEDTAKTLGVSQEFNRVIIVSSKAGFTQQALTHQEQNKYKLELWDSKKFKDELYKHMLKK